MLSTVSYFVEHQFIMSKTSANISNIPPLQPQTESSVYGVVTRQDGCKVCCNVSNYFSSSEHFF